eukprot:374502-Pelagomonas_calceolata.AAC.2
MHACLLARLPARLPAHLHTCLRTYLPACLHVFCTILTYKVSSAWRTTARAEACAHSTHLHSCLLASARFLHLLYN